MEESRIKELRKAAGERPRGRNLTQKDEEERPLQMSYSRPPFDPKSPSCPDPLCYHKDEEISSIQKEMRAKVVQMLRTNGYQPPSFHLAQPSEYTVELGELALVISQLLSDVSKRDKVIASLKEEKNTVVLEFSGYKERHEYSLREKARDLEDIVDIKEKELALCYSTINELRYKLEATRSPPPPPPPSRSQLASPSQLSILMRDNEKLFEDNKYLTIQVDEEKRLRSELEYETARLKASTGEGFADETRKLKDELQILRAKCQKLEEYNGRLFRDLSILQKAPRKHDPALSFRTAPAASLSTAADMLLQEAKQALGVQSDKDFLLAVGQVRDLLKALPKMEAFIKDVCIILQASEKLEVHDEKDIGMIIDCALPTLKQWALERESSKYLQMLKTELCELLYNVKSKGGSASAVSERQIVKDIEEIISFASRGQGKY